MFKLPTNVPKGTRVLSKDELLELKDGAASIVPKDSATVWGVECDQWCAHDLFLNALVMLSFIVVMIPLALMNLQRELSAASVIFIALCVALVILMVYFVAATLTRRVWLVFSPGKIGWFRESYWGKEKRVFNCRDIAAIHHTHPDGGKREERSLNIELRSKEQVVLLYDGGKTGMCAWIARIFREEVSPRNIEFVDQPLPAAT